jgi:hypothetical protein
MNSNTQDILPLLFLLLVTIVAAQNSTSTSPASKSNMAKYLFIGDPDNAGARQSHPRLAYRHSSRLLLHPGLRAITTLLLAYALVYGESP